MLLSVLLSVPLTLLPLMLPALLTLPELLPPVLPPAMLLAAERGPMAQINCFHEKNAKGYCSRKGCWNCVEITMWYWENEALYIMSIYIPGQPELDLEFDSARERAKYFDKWMRQRGLTDRMVTITWS